MTGAWRELNHGRARDVVYLLFLRALAITYAEGTGARNNYPRFTLIGLMECMELAPIQEEQAGHFEGAAVGRDIVSDAEENISIHVYHHHQGT